VEEGWAGKIYPGNLIISLVVKEKEKDRRAR